MNLRTGLGQFRLVALLEGGSYLLLFLTMILKYRFASPGPNYVVGMAHGVLFLAYVLLLMRVGVERSWSFGRMLLLFLASLIPLGTFYADARWLKPAEETNG